MMTKEEKYQLLTEQIKSLIDGETDAVAVMANVCAAIHEAMGFFWTGFYRVVAKGEKNGLGNQIHTTADGSEDQGPTPVDDTSSELVLGPFQGPVACIHIPFGRGVCGSAWQRRETLVVPDVEQFPGHIACSSLSRSEIVVPVFAPGDPSRVLAVLDIDSRELATFDDVDRRHLEAICRLVAPVL